MNQILYPKLCGILLFCNLLVATSVFAQAEKQPENPIGKFFRNLNKNVRDGAEEIQKAQQGRDQLDARPPQNPDLVRRLDQAREFLAEERWEDAVSVLQFLIEANTDSFYYDENLELQSLHSEVQQLLQQLPPDAARNYLNRFESVAQRELEFARETKDESLLRRLSNVFLKTPAGRAAAYTYAIGLYDQGQLRGASGILLNLARDSESGLTAKQFAMFAARIAAIHGDRELVGQLITEFDLPPEINETSFQLDPLIASNVDSTQLITTQAKVETKLDPQFIPLWTHQSVDRYLVEEQIESLFNDLEEANRAIILTSQCLLNNDLIAYHTLNGLEVRKVGTGELVWENRTEVSVESVLTDPGKSNISDPVYRGRVPEQHPIVSLFLRDGISRSLTTDGRHLFAIENHELLASPPRGYSWQRRMLADSPETEKLKTNEVVAYDFETGRIRWRLGGTVLEEPFTRPLAGTFFFGPPVSDGSDLYVIGERDGIVSLFALNAQTGELLWSQEIAHPSRGLIHDQVRRFWPCYPAIQDGVIICPTTCGWLVAVDLVSHRLLWGSRYTPRKQSKRTRAFAVQSVQDLNRRWLPSPPVIVGNRVIYTPQELPNEFNQDLLATYCFDLMTGSLLWQQQKEDGLYLAGIHEKQAIFVGQSNVISREIAGDGKVLWKTEFDATNGKPSGRSLILGDQLLVPINGQTLLQIDLNSGKVLNTSHLESSEVKLGSLYFENETLFSHSIFHTSAFPIQQLSPEQFNEFAKSFSAELISIEYLVSNQKFSAALDAIQDLRSQSFYQNTTEQQRQKIEEIEWNCMEQLVLIDDDLAEETLFTMQTLAESPTEIARYHRLAAIHERRLKNWKSAFNHLLMLLKNYSEDQFFSEQTRTVRADVWVSGQLLDLYESITEAEQRVFADSIEGELKELESTLGTARLARVISFLPAGARLELELAQTAAQADDYTEAIIYLQRVTQSQDARLAVQAWLDMATYLKKFDAIADARNCLKRVLELDSVAISPGEMSHSVAEERLQQLTTSNAASTDTVWGNSWEVFRTGSQGNDQVLKTLNSHGTPFEFQGNYKFLFQGQASRLFIERQQTGEYVWTLPLRSMSNINHRANVGILQTGAVSYVVHRGALQALYPLEQKVAWTHLPDVTGSALARLRTPSSRNTSVVNNLTSFRNIVDLQGYSTTTGILLAANEHCVLVMDEKIHALDPITGELLWSDSDVDKRVVARMIVDKILLTEKNEVFLRRSIDGEKITHPFDPLFQKECLAVFGERCLYLSQGEKSDEPWVLSLGTLQDKNTYWEIEFDPESLMVKLEERTFLSIAPDGEITLIDLSNGSQRSVGVVPGDLMEIHKRFYAYQDQDFIFLAVAHGNGRTSYVNLASLRASGTLICYSKTEGQLWSQNMEALAKQFSHQKLEEKAKDEEEEKQAEDEEENKNETVWSMNLIVEDLEESPLLLFISDRPEHRNKIYFRRLTMVGLDKRTGEPVFDWYRISNAGGFSYLHVDVRDRHIDLRTYNERLKIQPVQQQQANVNTGVR